MDSTTQNFGPLVMPAAKFAGPLDGGDISKITLSRYKTHFLKVTFIFPIKTQSCIEFNPCSRLKVP